MDIKFTRKQPNSHYLEVENGARKFEFKLALLSDLHWDNPDCDRDLLKKHLDYCKNNDIKVLLNGDTFCLMQGKYDPRSNKSKIRPEHNKANYLDAVVETAAEWFKPYADIILLIGYGNHETSIIKRQETDVIQRFVTLLNHIAKPIIPIEAGGYGGALSIGLGHSKNNKRTYNIHYFHGSGGGGVVTRGSINITRMLAMVDGYDCVTMGHVHESKEEVIIKNYYNNHSKTIKQREVLGVITGTYKDEYHEGQKGWHVERGAPPKPLGGRILTLNYNRPADGLIDIIAYTNKFPV